MPKKLELFQLIDNARVERGCARLGRNSGLTSNARSHASSEAKNNSTNTGSGTDAIADANSSNAAYNQLTRSYSGVIFDCGRDTLGIGFAAEESGLLCDVLPCATERRWVADF